MNRRFFLKILLSLGLGTYFPKLAQAENFEKLHQPQENFKILSEIKFLRQIVTNNSKTSRTLMWQSDKEIKNIQLEFFLVGDENAKFSPIFFEKFIQNDEEIFIYFSELKNLKPESLYKFRIISGERATSWKNLKTCGEKNFQMLVFSDSQCENYKIWQKTAESAQKNFPDAEIFTVIGDLVDNGQANYQWREFFKSAECLLNEKIFAPVMGNHECYSTKWLNCSPEGFLHNFKTPSNAEKNFDGYFYSFDYGAAHFFVLNTQFLELEDFQPKLKEIQNYWFRLDAMNSNKFWKIVLMHKDIFDYGQNKFNDIAENFMPLFDELKIDLVLTGHLHTYRNRGKIFNFKKSSQGTTYILCGRSGDQKYVEPHREIDDVFYENSPKEPETYITLEIYEKNLNLTCYTVDGEILDNFTLKK